MATVKDGIALHGKPERALSDRGPQFHASGPSGAVRAGRVPPAAGVHRALDEVPAPIDWRDAAVVWADYRLSGEPRNGWNQVPGHLFFKRV
jgi:hypothetical protein